MMIFWDAGLAILAVPKTATHALQEALAGDADMVIRNPPRQKHMPLRWFETAVRPIFADRDGARLETMAVVRDPLDWLGSWYRYRGRPALTGTPQSTKDHSFSEFVHAYLAADPPAFAAVGRQSRFVETASGEIGVDHVLAYESFPSVVSFLEHRLRRKIRLGRSNVSPPASLDLPTELAEKARKELHREFELHALAVAASTSKSASAQ